MRTERSSSAFARLSTAVVRGAFRESPLAGLFATGFGSGLSPFAPGTAGSALGLLLAWLLARAISPSAPSVTASVGLLMSGLAIGLAGVFPAARFARALGSKDPGCIVIDEIAGQFLASAAVPLFAPPSSPLLWLASFFLFRLFDVWKPGPIHGLQRLPEGWGIVADDVAAGLLAAGATAALALLLVHP